jgi:PAS domain S-box-containing protein
VPARAILPEDRNRLRLELLIGVSREVASALDLRTVLRRLLLAVLQHVGGERASIVVLDDLGVPVDATIVYGKRFLEHTTQQLRETVERGLAGWVVRHRKGALVPDTTKDERWLLRADDSPEKTGAKSAICVPLLARERLIGVLTLVHPAPQAFTQEHLELMQAIADQAGVAVLNARLYTESQRTARVMSALAEGAAAMNSSLEMPEVWRRILSQAMQALQVETVGLALIEAAESAEEKGEQLVLVASDGQNAGNLLGRRLPATAGLAGRVVREGRGIVVQDAATDQRFSEVDKFGGITTRALAIAPIHSQGQVIGVLEAINPIAGGFDPDATLVMVGLGSLAGTTIQNARFLEQLRQTHQLYRELFEESIDPILITDWEGRVREANRRALALSGFDLEQLRSMSIDQLHEVNWNRTGLEFETLNQQDRCVYDSVVFRQDGGTRPVEVHARRVQFEDADSVQWTLRDISARKELDSLRDDMTAMIYHDLRSPLGNIVSSLDMLGGMLPDDATMRTILEIANSSAARIQRLISSLLDISRLEAGQRIVDQQAVDPLALTAEAMREVEPQVQSRSQKLETKLPAALPLIWVDVDMIHRVLINLLENASKFTQVDGRIEVGAKAEGVFVRFWVSDNGPGIPVADRERVFDKFTRLRNKERAGGLGVGLAFCKLAVEAHGGELHLESEVGKGTTFWFTLSVAQQKRTSADLVRRIGKVKTKA